MASRSQLWHNARSPSAVTLSCAAQLAQGSTTHRTKTIAVLVTTLAGVVGRVSAAVTQVILGLFLTQGQFGIYATAIGITGFTAIMRAGGAATFLPTMKPDEFRRDSGRLFGWALLCMTTGAALTAAAAQPAAAWYEAPSLAWALYCLAARNVVSAVSLQARTRMAIDLRFKELAGFDAINSIVKLLASVGLAVWLAGTDYAVLALAGPYAFASVLELLYCVPASGITLAELTPQPRAIWATAKSLRWSFAFALVISINSQTNFAIISRLPLLPVAVVGVVYWSFQLASQPMTLLASGLQNVFTPIVARERGDPSKERDTIQRIFAGAMLLVPFVIFGAFSVFPAAETLIYRGRWAAATGPYFFLSIGICFATVNALLTGPLLGLRQFKTLAGFEAVRAVGFIGGTLAGYVVWRLAVNDEIASSPATVTSAGAGLGIAGVAAWQMFTIMRRFGMKPKEIARALLFGPTVALLGMTAAMSIGISITDSLGQSTLDPRQDAVVRLIVTGATFGIVTIICVRFMAEETLRRTVDVLPVRIRPGLTRALRL